MSSDTVSFWADIAAIFCVVQMLLVAIVFAIGLGMGWWYLRKGRKKLVMPLLMAQVYALRIEKGTLTVTDKIASVPIGINATAKQIQVTAQTLWRSSRAQGK